MTRRIERNLSFSHLIEQPWPSELNQIVDQLKDTLKSVTMNNDRQKTSNFWQDWRHTEKNWSIEWREEHFHWDSLIWARFDTRKREKLFKMYGSVKHTNWICCDLKSRKRQVFLLFAIAKQNDETTMFKKKKKINYSSMMIFHVHRMICFPFYSNLQKGKKVECRHSIGFQSRSNVNWRWWRSQVDVACWRITIFIFRSIYVSLK